MEHARDDGGRDDADERAGDARTPLFGQTTMTATTSSPMSAACQFTWNPSRP